MPSEVSNRGAFSGTIYTVAAFVMWGFLPVYWKQLYHVSADEIVLHRVVWSCLIVMIFVFSSGRKKVFINILKSPRLRVIVLAASVTISLNWLTYVFAVNAGHIVEASLGYFINPLVSIFLGMVVLKERLSRMQIAALLLACAAVLYQTVSFGRFPWIAFFLAFSFGFYGLIKKMGGMDSMTALGMETLFLLPIALPVLFLRAWDGSGALGNISGETDLLLISSGLITAVPLLCFASGAKRIPLSSVGFIQYIGPTLMLIIGVTVYGESFTSTHGVSFSLIWIALILYSLSAFVGRRRAG